MTEELIQLAKEIYKVHLAEGKIWEKHLWGWELSDLECDILYNFKFELADKESLRDLDKTLSILEEEHRKANEYNRAHNHPEVPPITKEQALIIIGQNMKSHKKELKEDSIKYGVDMATLVKELKQIITQIK